MAQIMGLHRDPDHFPAVLPIEAEIRRRVWWHLIHIDVALTISSGLPPIIDQDSWDVRLPTEVKDEFIGTPQAMEYDAAVLSGAIAPAEADSAESVLKTSLVSTGGILVGGKLRNACRCHSISECCANVNSEALVTLHLVTIKQALVTLSGSATLSAEDIRGLRECFRKNTEQLHARILRIPASEIRISDPNASSYHDQEQGQMNTWARTLLAAFINKNWSKSY